MSKGAPNPRALRAFWLLMFNQGGWWTSKQLNQELGSFARGGDFFPSVTARVLAEAAKSNYLAVRPAEPGHYGNQYAVIPNCHVPRCVTVGEVLK